MEPEGRCGSPRPRRVTMVTNVQDIIKPTERNLRSPDATEPLSRWLIAAAKEWTTITYGEVGRRLEEEHGFGKIFPRLRVKTAADALMDEILFVDKSSPLLVSLLVNGKTKLPGEGFAKKYLDECGSGSRERAEERVKKAMEEVYAYRYWDDLYERLYENEDAERRRSRRALGSESRSRDAPRSRSGEFPAPVPLTPNAETVEAIEAARRGDLVTVGGVDGLMAHLNEDD